MRQRRRGVLVVLIAVVIGLGLSCRRPSAPAFVQLYLGDVLWGSLFFLLLTLLWPRRGSWRLAAYAIATTEAIELSQLHQADWANQLRSTRLGGLLLGHGFLWSDVLRVLLGAAVAAAVDARRARSHAAAMVRGLGVTLLAALLLGCSTDEPTRADFQDDGSVCLKLLGDGTVEATVTFRTCLSSCDRALPSSCGIALDGSTLRFSSHGASERTDGSTCTEVCARLSATCRSSEKVAPGTHLIVHGEDMAIIALGTRSQCLFLDET
jgi:hypothetical protein